MSSRQWSLGFVLVFAVLAACGGEKKQTRVAAPRATPIAETTITSAPMTQTEPVSPSISVSSELMRACSLHLNDVATAPKFDFDESELLPLDYEVLGKIGRCLSSQGALHGRSIRLIGRADPRGTMEYNMALGARRAHNVGAFLEEFGIERGRIFETSRGELDATGTNEATWQIDRRVDILLAD